MDYSFMKMLKLHFLIFLALLTGLLPIYGKTTPTATEKSTPDPDPTAKMRDWSEVDMISIMNECNETFRTEMSYIESLNKSGSFPDETDRTPKCFVRCMLEKNSVMSEDGMFDQDQALIFFAMQRPGTDVDDFRDSTEACNNRNETCMCERSYRYVKCVVEMKLNKNY